MTSTYLMIPINNNILMSRERAGAHRRLRFNTDLIVSHYTQEAELCVFSIRLEKKASMEISNQRGTRRGMDGLCHSATRQRLKKRRKTSPPAGFGCRTVKDSLCHLDKQAELVSSACALTHSLNPRLAGAVAVISIICSSRISHTRTVHLLNPDAVVRGTRCYAESSREIRNKLGINQENGTTWKFMYFCAIQIISTNIQCLLVIYSLSLVLTR